MKKMLAVALLSVIGIVRAQTSPNGGVGALAPSVATQVGGRDSLSRLQTLRLDPSGNLQVNVMAGAGGAPVAYAEAAMIALGNAITLTPDQPGALVAWIEDDPGGASLEATVFCSLDNATFFPLSLRAVNDYTEEIFTLLPGESGRGSAAGCRYVRLEVTAYTSGSVQGHLAVSSLGVDYAPIPVGTTGGGSGVPQTAYNLGFGDSGVFTAADRTTPLPMAVTSTADAIVKPGDAVNNALRVNVVAGSAAGTASFEQPGGVDQEARVYDTDTGGGTEWTAGAQIRGGASGGSVAAEVMNSAPAGTEYGLVVRMAGGASGGTSSSFGAAFPGTGTAAGFSDGTNMAGARVFDADTGAGTQHVLGSQLRLEATGGSVPVSVTDPLPIVNYDNNGNELDFRLENENWNAADHGILIFGRDVESVPNKYRALRLDTDGRLLSHTENSTHTFTLDFSNFDYDTGGGTANTSMLGIALPASGGPVAGGTATNPIRTDPTGSTTQPVSGTVTVTDGAGALNVIVDSGTLTAVTSITNPVTVSDGAGAMNVIVDSGTLTAVTSITNPVTVTDGAGSLNVIVDSGTLTAVTSITNTVTVQGASADNSAAGSTSTGTLPGIVETSTTPPTRTDGNRAALALDSDGKTYVRTFDWDPLSANSGLSTATALTQIVAAPGASVSIYLTNITFSSSVVSTTTADQQMTLKYGTGTNCGTGTTYLWGAFNPAFGGAVVSFAQPIKITANNALCWIHAATGSKIVVVNYFLAP